MSMAVSIPIHHSISLLLTEASGTFFTRYDFENVSSEGAGKLTGALTDKISKSDFIGSEISGRKVTDAGDFSYTDPVDGSVAKNQGLYVKFDDGSRFVVRLSGTGSSGATIRLYVEKHESDKAKFDLDAQEYLKDNVQMALKFLGFKEFVETEKPTVIT